jgi:hypothetical protein
MPVERLENGTWPHPARLPLGCGYSGHCTAPGHEGQIPQQEVLEAFCNLGYAGTCNWAPRERGWDAVRFAVASPAGRDKSQGRKNNLTPAYRIRICYACEREHRPVQGGDLEFDLQQSTWLRKHEDPRLQKMAECFLDAYLKKSHS